MEGKTVNAIDGTSDNVEAAVLQRYGNAAQEVEACLCLPVSYDQALLKVIPDEIIEKDYGCGDPSRYVREGETVLDLGSGSGKGCYIIAQIVGAGDLAQARGVDSEVRKEGREQDRRARAEAIPVTGRMATRSASGTSR